MFASRDPRSSATAWSCRTRKGPARPATPPRAPPDRRRLLPCDRQTLFESPGSLRSPSDELALLPLGPDRLVALVGFLDGVFGGRGAGGRAREHGVQEPGAVALV